MLKKFIKRFVLGFVIEAFAAYLITIIISLCIGTGEYYGIHPQIMKLCKTELGGVVFQFFIAGGLGAVFGSSSLIWEIDRWSLAKQTVAHFIVINIAMLFSAYVCHWMSHTVKGFLSWIGMFVVIYIIVWIICYTSFKKKVDGINKTLMTR